VEARLDCAEGRILAIDELATVVGATLTPSCPLVPKLHELLTGSRRLMKRLRHIVIARITVRR
jgi:hypothetical protein